MLAGVLASAVLAWLYARGGAGWLLGFVALVPWLLALEASRTLRGTLLCAYAMSVAFTAAVFSWFGAAIGSYAHLGPGGGLFVLLLAAPLFQPQFVVFALVRHLTRRRHGPLLGALAAASHGWRRSGSCRGCSATRSATVSIRPGCCARLPTWAARPASRFCSS
jgi:apolipoprotein N-acyltransferase